MDVALVGCGRWGRLILRDLRSLGCAVHVVARSDESRARARDGGAASIVGSLDELPAVAGVVVATTTDTHAQVLDAVLPLGIPVFVEKPLTDDLSAVDRLVEAGSGRLFIMDKWRYHPGVEAMGQMARSGEFGRLEAIYTRRLSWGQSHDDVDAVWILAPHDLSIVYEVAGFLPEAIAAAGTRGAGQDAGMTGILGPEPTVVIDVSSLSPVWERRVVAQFEEAVVLLGDAYAEGLRILRVGSADDEGEMMPLPDDMPLLAELTAFVEHIRGGPAPRSSVEEGALIVRRIAELRAMAGI